MRREGDGKKLRKAGKDAIFGGKGPRLDTPSLPSLQKPQCPPPRRGGGWNHTHVPDSNSPRARRPPLGGPEARWGLSLRTKLGWRDAPRRGPGASGGLAARPHVAGPQGGAGGPAAQGGGFTSPGSSRMVAASQRRALFLPGGSACPTDEGEVSQKKCPARCGALEPPGVAAW